jgi:hypothetical protein
MSDPNKPAGMDPAFIRGLTQPRLSRSNFLRGGAAGLGLLALGAGKASATETKDWPAWWAAQKPTKDFVFANWPYYIDVTSNGSGHPSLDAFTKATGIKVKYLEVIQEIPSFYAKIAPVLKAGQSTGYDIVVITNRWELQELILQNWLTPLPHDKLPNFKKYASPNVVNPSYDPGNKYTAVWQSGFTGIAYNPKLTKRDHLDRRSLGPRLRRPCRHDERQSGTWQRRPAETWDRPRELHPGGLGKSGGGPAGPEIQRSGAAILRPELYQRARKR